MLGKERKGVLVRGDYRKRRVVRLAFQLKWTAYILVLCLLRDLQHSLVSLSPKVSRFYDNDCLIVSRGGFIVSRGGWG